MIDNDYIKRLRKKFKNKKMRMIIREYIKLYEINIFNTYANIIDLDYTNISNWNETKKIMLFIAIKEQFHLDDFEIIYKFKKPRSKKTFDRYKYILLRMIIYSRDMRRNIEYK